MKKEVKNVNGITLIALVITVIIILILSSVAIYTGKSIISSSKLTKFTAEMKIMQMQVNDLYDKYKNGDNAILELGEDLSSNEQENTAFSGAGIIDTTGYRFFSQTTIESLNIEGVDGEFLINVEKRSVVSYEGLNYDGEMYYTLEQLPKSLYNVSSNSNDGMPTFEAKAENIAIGKWKIIISNITYLDGYIEKWYVKYRFSEDDEEGINEEDKKWNTSEDLSFIVNEEGNYEVYIQDQSGNVKSDIVTVYVDGWKEVSVQEWNYNYASSKVNEPKLIGDMKPINYVGEVQEGNKWANAKTSDGSMWVWIPRYAYRITEGYHTNEAGTIEVAFLDKENNFINNDCGDIDLIELGLTDEDGKQWSEEDVTYINNEQQQWVLHPAFTSYPEYGGWSEELDGIWIGKFEATGTYDTTNKTGTLSVKPGETSLCSMTINEQYKLAKRSTFGETASINSHMAKNSEWGAIVYLGHSKYGTNAQKVENNNSEYITGGSSKLSKIYKSNVNQSTTYNATGVYDMNGGAWERTAGYAYITTSSYLQNNGGLESGDLYGIDAKEQSESTAYKTVYESVNNRLTDYTTAQKYKGDAVYEISNSQSSSTGSWFAIFANFPTSTSPFFTRSGGSRDGHTGTFCFNDANGNANSIYSFRPVLAF